MFGGVAAFLEKIDQRVEAIADEHERAEAEQVAIQSAASPSVAGQRHGSTFPPLSPHAMSSRVEQGFRRGDLGSRPLVSSGGGGGEESAKSAGGRGSGGAASSTAGSSQHQPQQIADDGTASAASSSSRNAAHQRQSSLQQQQQQPAGRLASLFSSTGAAPTMESLKVQHASLQQTVATLEEELERAQSTLVERQAAFEQLDAKRTAAEAEKAQWRREAAYYKDIATTSRDQLTRCEGEMRVLRELQEVTGKELQAHKASSRRLIEEKEAEIVELKNKLQAGGSAAHATLERATDAAAASKVTELETALSQLRNKCSDREADNLHLQNALTAAERERERARQQQHQLEQQVDSLRLEVRALTESLEGEGVVHQELTAQLKQTRSELHAAQAGIESAGRGAYGTATSRRAEALPSRDDGESESPAGSPTASAAVIANLEDALSEAQQKAQVLSFQLVEKQATLDASARELAEWRGRFNALARRIGDEEIAAAAGYGGGGGGLSFPKPPGAHLKAHEGERGGEVAVHVSGRGAGTTTVGGAAAAPSGDLKRNPTLLQLSRKSKAGRLIVELLAKMDDVALKLAHHLRSHAVARVVVEGYICLLQLWVLFMFVSNLTLSVEAE